jgi:hypothetical protein
MLSVSGAHRAGYDAPSQAPVSLLRGVLRVVIGLNASGYTADARREGTALTTREEEQHACSGVFAQSPSDGSRIQLLENTMPISAGGEIAYQGAPPMGGYGCRPIHRSAIAAGGRLPGRLLGVPPWWARRPTPAALNSSSVPRAPRCATLA